MRTTHGMTIRMIIAILAGALLFGGAGACAAAIPGNMPIVRAMEPAERVARLHEEATDALDADDWRRTRRIAWRWIRIEPDDDYPWLLLAWTYAAENDFRGMIKSYRQAFRIKVDQPYFVWHSLGIAYYNLRRYGDALVAYERAVLMNSSDADLQRDLCQAHLASGNAAAAAKAASAALQITPDFAEAWLCRGLALSDMQRLDEAEHALREATIGKLYESDTDRGAIWAALGGLYHKLGRMEEVQEALERLQRWNAKAAEKFRQQYLRRAE